MFVRIAIICSFVLWHCSLHARAIWVTQDKIYHIENEKFLNWSDADKHCQDMNMNLFTITSKMEFIELKHYINETYNRVLPYWIGAHKANGEFKWLTYEEAISPSQFIWHDGEPNNKSGNELCIHTWENDFDWNDNDCELKLPFICELRIKCAKQNTTDNNAIVSRENK